MYNLQVLSKSVSDALLLFGGPEAEETATFVKMFDEWFDAVNVCNFSDGQYQRKPFKNPYRSGEDFRLEVYNLYNIHFAYMYFYYSGLSQHF